MSDGVRLIQLRDKYDYQSAQSAVTRAPEGWVVTIRPATRSTEQNAKLHALLQDIVRMRVKWAGRTWSLDDWKAIMVSGHARATRGDTGKPDVIPGLEGEIVPIRESTARMSKERLSSLIEYVSAWVAQNASEP